MTEQISEMYASFTSFPPDPTGVVMAEGTRTSSSSSSNTRRLPSWMVGAPAAASSAKVTNNKTLDGEADINTEEKKGRKRPEAKDKPILTRKSKAVQETKERATAADDFGDGDKNKQRNKRRKKAKAKRYDQEDEDEGGGGGIEAEEEEELTVEDLVNIAAGYVKAADNELNAKQKGKPVLNQESQHETLLPVTMRSSGNDLVEGSFGNEPGASPVADAAVSCGSTASLPSGQNFIEVGSAGDPAQDMLDLFLGPLLRKLPPPREGRKSEFVTENIDLAHEFKKQSHNGIGEEMPPLKKKKSSLRDTVSLLLD